MLTDAQKQIRFQGIGGSDVAAMLGLSPWRTPMSLYLEKVNHLVDENQNLFMELGHDLEPIVAKYFEKKTNKKCELAEETIIHPEFKFMLANVDRRIADENALLECKATGELTKSKGWGDEGTDEMPQHYLLQIAHYAMVCNVEIVYLAAMSWGREVKIYTYQRNHKLEAKLLQREKDFWLNHIEKRIPPAPTNLEDVKAFWADAGMGKILSADKAIEDSWEKMSVINKQIKELEKQKEELQFRLCEAIQDNEIVKDAAGKVLITWKNRSNNRFDVTAFKKEHPDLFDKFTKQSTTRVFLLKESKE